MTPTPFLALFKKYRWQLGLGLVLLLTVGLRFYQLGQVPHGMTWDEAAIGYNGSAIWRTRRDEWIQFLPVSFRSFGDYKAPLAIYLNGLFTAWWGMNLAAVRLPFAVSGVLAVWGMMLLIKELWSPASIVAGSSPTSQSRWLVWASGLMMALSPWHLHFTRAGFESGLALTFLIWSLYLLIKFIQSAVNNWWWLVISVLLAVAAVYSYHSAKLVVPLLWWWIVIVYRRQFVKRWQISLGAGVIGGGMLWPLVKDALAGHGLTRVNTTLWGQLKGMELVVAALKNWLLHLSPQFLMLGQTTTLRHGTGAWGVLLPTTLLLAIGGLIYGVQTWLVKDRSPAFTSASSSPVSKLAVNLGLIWVGVGLIPAAIGQEVPHPNRALLALPGFIILAVIGLTATVNWLSRTRLNHRLRGSHGETNILVLSWVGSLILIHSLLAVNFLHYYYTQFAAASAAAFKDGYLAAFQLAASYEDQVDKILFTSDYGQPYIYALFVRKTNPIWYQGGSLIKYEFTNQINDGDLQRSRTLIVASQTDEISLEKADQLIYGSDGQPRFKVYWPVE